MANVYSGEELGEHCIARYAVYYICRFFMPFCILLSLASLPIMP
jgi:hypothetical protein